jgi:hypothetical protein
LLVIELKIILVAFHRIPTGECGYGHKLMAISNSNVIGT